MLDGLATDWRWIANGLTDWRIGDVWGRIGRLVHDCYQIGNVLVMDWHVILQIGDNLVDWSRIDIGLAD